MMITENQVNALLKDFVKKNGYILRDSTDGYYWKCVLNTSFLRVYENVGLSYGDVFNMSYIDEGTDEIEISINSDGTDKRVIRRLSKKYNLQCILYEYDQDTAPHWIYDFSLEPDINTIESFLNDFTSFSIEYEKNYPALRESDPVFYFALKENRGLKEAWTDIFIVEKEDWDHFGKLIHEYYHDERMKPISDIKEKFGLKLARRGFKSDEAAIELKEKLLAHPNLAYCETFQNHFDKE